MSTKVRTALTALSVAASMSLVGGLALSANVYANGHGHGHSGVHGKSGQHGDSGKHKNSGMHGKSGTDDDTSNTSTTNGSTGGTTSNTSMNASQQCKSTGNAVLSYSSMTNGTTTANNVPMSHGACVSLMRSHGHSSAIAASLCKYLVKNGGTFNNVSLVSGFPAGTTATNVTNILSKLATNTTTPKNVGQCVKAYNQAKHAVFASKH